MNNVAVFVFIVISAISVFCAARYKFSFIVPLFAAGVIGAKTSFVFFGLKTLFILFLVGAVLFSPAYFFKKAFKYFSLLAAVSVSLIILLLIC
ncbi:MAG: hypothetical protein J7L54_00470 [Elusimicrobia bacterium]|nr:hypothetical protein [Elusimicrobiota bacterium]